MFRGLFVVMLAVWLSGCDNFTEAEPMMNEYLERLARVLEVEAVERPPLPTASPLPRRRERLQSLPELELGMLDFLSLYGCELQVVIGEKASVLGRVMQPVNRLRYEVRFIQAAEACLPEIDDTELHDDLRKAVTSKRESLAKAVWNATWGSEEIERLLTLSKGYYPVDYNAGSSADLVRDLRQLNGMVEQLASQQLEVSLADLGAIHQRWQAEFKAGQLINSARLLIATMNAGTRMLEVRIDERPLCLNGNPNNQSDIVQNFFFAIYIEKIQPYMSLVSRAHDTLIAELEQLAQQQAGVMPESFNDWYRRHLARDLEGSLWWELDRAMARHTRHWQKLLGQCGLRPQA
ncbi:Protein of unknown function [Marinobacter persicus]|jgi:hypothetical protein|uniref:DUF3080 family protein n=1 Tax=Marinobacter persicus TaxID=930118 RepID=A0A1I3Y3N6_9GAMM|nr:DUF3080 domain-containing protein [Marinobacter persicus]GHD53257.1 hypothetical protein GCM10008110_26950 [Marinobacter persicus]SFK26425.1 Protein of unknown function [Marinobacter persicus]